MKNNKTRKLTRKLTRKRTRKLTRKHTKQRKHKKRTTITTKRKQWGGMDRVGTVSDTLDDSDTFGDSETLDIQDISELLAIRPPENPPYNTITNSSGGFVSEEIISFRPLNVYSIDDLQLSRQWPEMIASSSIFNIQVIYLVVTDYYKELIKWNHLDLQPFTDLEVLFIDYIEEDVNTVLPPIQGVKKVIIDGISIPADNPDRHRHFFSGITSELEISRTYDGKNVSLEAVIRHLPDTMIKLSIERCRIPTQVIPDCLRHLTSLQTLELSNINLSGTIPNIFEHLRFLTTLNLSYNELTGEIPDSISNLIYLERLELDGNSLTGDLPDFSSVAVFPNLEFLDVGINQMKIDESKLGFRGINLNRFPRLTHLGVRQRDKNETANINQAIIMAIGTSSDVDITHELNVDGNFFDAYDDSDLGTVERMVSIARQLEDSAEPLM